MLPVDDFTVTQHAPVVAVSVNVYDGAGGTYVALVGVDVVATNDVGTVVVVALGAVVVVVRPWPAVVVVPWPAVVVVPVWLVVDVVWRGWSSTSSWRGWRSSSWRWRRNGGAGPGRR